MDWQVVATWGWTIISGLLGWLLREVWNAVKQQREDIGKLEVALPREYVSKADLAPLIQDVRQTLYRIENKLDQKQDKHGTAARS